MTGLWADIVVVGGGAIGLTSAWYLAKSGWKVVLLDKDQLGKAASWAGAGIIPPGDPLQATGPLDKLRAWGSHLHRKIHEELLDLTGIDNGYRVCGGIDLIESETSPTWTQRLAGLQRESIRLEILDSGKIQRLLPGLSHNLGVYFPEMAQIRNPRHIRALIQACVQHHVALHTKTQVVTYQTTGDRVSSVILQDGREIHLGHILFAMGAWTADLAREPFGFSAGVVPVRGQMIQVEIPESSQWPILESGKKYLVPRGDGLVLVGSTEESAGFDASTTPDGQKLLLEFLQSCLPRLRGLEPIRAWAGLRPHATRGMPYMGRLPGFSNAYINAGHFRWGLQFSPRSAELICDLIQGPGKLANEIAPFSVEAQPEAPGPLLFSS